MSLLFIIIFILFSSISTCTLYCLNSKLYNNYFKAFDTFVSISVIVILSVSGCFCLGHFEFTSKSLVNLHFISIESRVIQTST